MPCFARLDEDIFELEQPEIVKIGRKRRKRIGFILYY
jgi:hypothetical protein